MFIGCLGSAVADK